MLTAIYWQKTGNFHTCHNATGPKTHHTYIETLEIACPNVDATAPLLDTNLATKGITEHTSAAIFETSSGSK